MSYLATNAAGRTRNVPMKYITKEFNPAGMSQFLDPYTTMHKRAKKTGALESVPLHMMQDNASMRVLQFHHRPGLDPIDDPEVNHVMISDAEITAIGVATGALVDVYRVSDEHAVTFRNKLDPSFAPVYMPALSESSRFLDLIRASRYNDNVMANLAGGGTNLGQKMQSRHNANVQSQINNSDWPGKDGGRNRNPNGYAQMSATGGDTGSQAAAMRPLHNRMQSDARRHAARRQRGGPGAYKGLGGKPNDGIGEMRSLHAELQGSLAVTSSVTDGGQSLALPGGANFSFDAKDAALPAAGSVGIVGGERTPALVELARAEMRSHQPAVQSSMPPAVNQAAVLAGQQSNSEGGSTGTGGVNAPQSNSAGNAAAERDPEALPSGVSSADAEKAQAGNQVVAATLATGMVDAHKPVVPGQKVVDNLANDPANIKNTAGTFQEPHSTTPTRMPMARDAQPPNTSAPTSNGLDHPGFIDKMRSIGLSYAAGASDSMVTRATQGVKDLANKYRHHLLDDQYDTLMGLSSQILEGSKSGRKSGSRSMRQFLSFL